MTSNNLKSYLITDPRYYGDEIETFSLTLTKALIQYSPDYACFRDKRESSDKRELARRFLEIAKKKSVKSFLNSDFETAYNLGFDGVHFPSNMFDRIEKAKNLGLEVFASCHTAAEIEFCKKIGVNAVTLSPVFASPDKGKPLGIKRFDNILKATEIKVFALGGIIDDTQIEKIKKTNAYGFASIRYFVD